MKSKGGKSKTGTNLAEDIRKELKNAGPDFDKLSELAKDYSEIFFEDYRISFEILTEALDLARACIEAGVPAGIDAAETLIPRLQRVEGGEKNPQVRQFFDDLPSCVSIFDNKSDEETKDLLEAFEGILCRFIICDFGPNIFLAALFDDRVHVFYMFCARQLSTYRYFRDLDTDSRRSTLEMMAGILRKFLYPEGYDKFVLSKCNALFERVCDQAIVGEGGRNPFSKEFKDLYMLIQQGLSGDNNQEWEIFWNKLMGVIFNVCANYTDFSLVFDPEAMEYIIQLAMQANDRKCEGGSNCECMDEDDEVYVKAWNLISVMAMSKSALLKPYGSQVHTSYKKHGNIMFLKVLVNMYPHYPIDQKFLDSTVTQTFASGNRGRTTIGLGFLENIALTDAGRFTVDHIDQFDQGIQNTKLHLMWIIKILASIASNNPKLFEGRGRVYVDAVLQNSDIYKNVNRILVYRALVNEDEAPKVVELLINQEAFVMKSQPVIVDILRSLHKIAYVHPFAVSPYLDWVQAQANNPVTKMEAMRVEEHLAKVGIVAPGKKDSSCCSIQ